MFLAIHEGDDGETFVAMGPDKDALREHVLALCVETCMEDLMPDDVKEVVSDLVAVGRAREAQATIDLYLPHVNLLVARFLSGLKFEKA
jgi:hypothetical protein